MVNPKFLIRILVVSKVISNTELWSLKSVESAELLLPPPDENPLPVELAAAFVVVLDMVVEAIIVVVDALPVVVEAIAAVVVVL